MSRNLNQVPHELPNPTKAIALIKKKGLWTVATIEIYNDRVQKIEFGELDERNLAREQFRRKCADLYFK